MARINLLPWREWERERRKNEFLIRLGGSVLFGALIVFAGGWYLDNSVEQQNARNRNNQSTLHAVHRSSCRKQMIRDPRQLPIPNLQFPIVGSWEFEIGS